MDAKTEELRAAHDVLAEFCAAGLGHQRRGHRLRNGTGRLEPYLAAKGLSPRRIDLSPEMIQVAQPDHPGFSFEVADVRELPFGDTSLAGVACWYSLMFLAPPDRPAAFGELARVVRPGGYLATAFKAGDSHLRRAGRSTGLGVEFDIYWLASGRGWSAR
jgi:SAM-dependent methyltransferase